MGSQGRRVGGKFRKPWPNPRPREPFPTSAQARGTQIDATEVFLALAVNAEFRHYPPFVTLTRASGFRLNMSHAEVVLTRGLLNKQNLNAWRNYETNADLVCGRGGINDRCFTPDSFSRATGISAACAPAATPVPAAASPAPQRFPQIEAAMHHLEEAKRELRLPRRNSMGTG